MKHTRLGMVAMVVLFGVGCVEQEPARPTAADWSVIRQNVLKKAPALKYQVNADLEGKVTYLGLDIDTEVVTPGKQFTVTHYWQVKQPVPGWKIFVHLNDPAQRKFINADHTPIGGRYPAAMWKAGEIVRDEHKIMIPANWGFPRLNVYTGLWRGDLRMKPKGPQDGKNRILAASLPVGGGGKGVAKEARARLVATRTAKPVVVDGKLDDAVWSRAQATQPFRNTMTGAAGGVVTTAKAAWDDANLYIAFDNRDADIWSSLKQRDDKLWTEEAVEVFIDANGDGRDYVELQVNPNGAIFDSYLRAYRRNDNAWNGEIKAAVQVDGTLEERGDVDRGWTVELAVPWAATKGKGRYELRLPPHVGDAWRVNFFRLDLPAKKRQVAVGWSPPLIGDFHKLDRFGDLLFGDEAGKVPAPAPAVAAKAARAEPAPKSGKSSPKATTLEEQRARLKRNIERQQAAAAKSAATPKKPAAN